MLACSHQESRERRERLPSGLDDACFMGTALAAFTHVISFNPLLKLARNGLLSLFYSNQDSERVSTWVKVTHLVSVRARIQIHVYFLSKLCSLYHESKQNHCMFQLKSHPITIPISQVKKLSPERRSNLPKVTR